TGSSGAMRSDDSQLIESAATRAAERDRHQPAEADGDAISVKPSAEAAARPRTRARRMESSREGLSEFNPRNAPRASVEAPRGVVPAPGDSRVRPEETCLGGSPAARRRGRRRLGDRPALRVDLEDADRLRRDQRAVGEELELVDPRARERDVA